MTAERQKDLETFTKKHPEDLVMSVSNDDVSDAVERIEHLDVDFDWSVEREGKYAKISDEVKQNGGSELEANIVSGAVKLLDILEERGIELEERGVFRTTDWDGVINSLESEDHDGIYPGVAEAKATYPYSENEIGEAVVTARGLDYIDHKTDILGWRDEIPLAAENGNVISYDGEIFVRDNEGYRPEDVSPLTTRPLANFQQLLRRQAALNDLKLIFGKSISPARLTAAVEEVESTGLRGDSFYAENFSQDPDKLEEEIEEVARSFGYPDPEVRELENDEDYRSVPWFEESNPIVRDGDKFIYPDDSNANSILDEALKKHAPYREVRYSLHEERDDLVVLEHDRESRDISFEEAVKTMERAAYLSQVTRGDNIEIEENEDGWIDAYIGLDSSMPVKELAAQVIADMTYPSEGAEKSVIFHMDDRCAGVMESANTVPFLKDGYSGEAYAEREGIEHVSSVAFPDFYLTVSEALHRYDDLDQLEPC